MGGDVNIRGAVHESQLSDAALLDRVAARDEEALGELYDRHAPSAYRLALRVIRDRTLAEDAVQDVFLGLWRSPRSCDVRKGSVLGWIAMLAHRRAVDIVRRQERSRQLAEPADVRREGGPEEMAEVSANGARVRRALARLSAEHRTVVELAYYGGLTQSQLAARLSIPLGTVKSRTSVALGQLRSFLTEDDLGRAA
jgi:RNA polymerase sigma-70 factor (ECF subfamily)